VPLRDVKTSWFRLNMARVAWMQARKAWCRVVTYYHRVQGLGHSQSTLRH